jgi:hypothetical protein
MPARHDHSMTEQPNLRRFTAQTEQGTPHFFPYIRAAEILPGPDRAGL